MEAFVKSLVDWEHHEIKLYCIENMTNYSCLRLKMVIYSKDKMSNQAYVKSNLCSLFLKFSFIHFIIPLITFTITDTVNLSNSITPTPIYMCNLYLLFQSLFPILLQLFSNLVKFCILIIKLHIIISINLQLERYQPLKFAKSLLALQVYKSKIQYLTHHSDVLLSQKAKKTMFLQ